MDSSCNNLRRLVTRGIDEMISFGVKPGEAHENVNVSPELATKICQEMLLYSFGGVCVNTEIEKECVTYVSDLEYPSARRELFDKIYRIVSCLA